MSFFSVKHCNFTPDFSDYLIFKSNFRFPWRFQNSEFRCVFGMIIVSLDVRIGNVFVFTAIWVRIYNWRFRAFCNFFWAIRSPPPQVRRCPYAYGFYSMKRTKIFQNTATKPLYNHSIFLINIRVLLFDSFTVIKFVAANVLFKYWLFLGVDLFCTRCNYYCYEWYIYFYVFPSFILLKPALANH